jgi:hypothetical protein
MLSAPATYLRQKWSELDFLTPCMHAKSTLWPMIPIYAIQPQITTVDVGKQRITFRNLG